MFFKINFLITDHKNGRERRRTTGFLPKGNREEAGAKKGGTRKCLCVRGRKEGWGRGANNEGWTNERGRKDKRQKTVYSVMLCWERSTTQWEAGSECHKNNHKPPLPLDKLCNAKQLSVFLFTLESLSFCIFYWAPNKGIIVTQHLPN